MVLRGRNQLFDVTPLTKTHATCAHGPSHDRNPPTSPSGEDALNALKQTAQCKPSREPSSQNRRRICGGQAEYINCISVQHILLKRKDLQVHGSQR